MSSWFKRDRMGASVGTKNRILHHATRSDVARGVYGKLQQVPLLGFCVQRLVRAALPPGKKLWVCIPDGTAKGFWIYADPRFDLGYLNGDYEPWIQDLLKRELKTGNCYYDVGAHTGFFALIASRYVGSSGNIIALEPDPDNIGILQANIARNKVEQVRAVQAAVWSSAGELTFERALEQSNRTQGHIMTEPNSRLAHIQVPTITLDDLVFKEQYPVPDFIKMDVEGAEWEALQGAKRLLREKKPKLFCEIHNATDTVNIRDYLRQLGYNADPWNPVHEHYADYRQTYLWAVPQGTCKVGSSTSGGRHGIG